MSEARIDINGQRLTSGQAATVRVALIDFVEYVSDSKNAKALGSIAQPYKERANEVLRLIFEVAK